MSTTIAAIRTGLNSVITGTTPASDNYGRAAYVQASEYHPFESEAGIDREFMIGQVTPGDPLSIGLPTTSLFEANFELEIGHWKVADVTSGMSRRDSDLYQVVRELEDKGNYPSGVALIRLESVSSMDNEKYWLTTLRFRIIYDGAL